MSDIAVGYGLVIDEYQRLQRDNPNHELLRYISITPGGIGFTSTQDSTLQGEFLTKFAGKETKVFQMWINYFIAMRRAVDKIEGIDREPKREQKSRLVLETTVNSSDEDLPF